MELLDEAQVEEALALQRETGWPLDKVILSKGLLSEHDLLRAMSNSLSMAYSETLSQAVVPPVFVERVPVQFARNYYLVGLDQENGAMRVATASPFDAYPMDDLATMLGMELEPVLAPRTEITSLINKAYRNKQDIVEESLGEFKDDDLETLAAEVGDSEDILDVANKAPIIKLVNTLFFQALKMRASDIHLQPFEDRLQVRYRIDGILYDMEAIPKKIQDAVTSRIKVQGKLDIAERRLPQDGRSSLRLGDSEVDVRISVVPTNYGERIVMRLLDKSARLYALEEIGLYDREPRDDRRVHPLQPRDHLRLRPHRLGQDHDALLLPHAHQQHQDERDDDRGPDRVPPAGHQPDPGEREEGADLRLRAALPAAPGPRHHDGR